MKKKLSTESAFEVFYAIREAQRQTIKALQEYMGSHNIARGGCFIHGDNGPVWYEKIADHPKVRAKMGPGR
jgi:hypothetical protein